MKLRYKIEASALDEEGLTVNYFLYLNAENEEFAIIEAIETASEEYSDIMILEVKRQWE